MGSFLRYLKEQKEIEKNQKELDEINKRLDNDKEAQELIDDINDDLDSDKSLEESELLEGDGSPFETDGTFYDGATDEVVGKDSEPQKNLNEEDEKINASDTFKFLNKVKDNPPSFDEIKSSFQNFRLKDGKIQKRTDKFFGNYVDMTDDEIKDFISKVNDKRVLKKKIFKIDDKGQIYSSVIKNNELGDVEVIKKETPIKNPKTMGRICMLLNIMYEDKLPNTLFWWKDKEGSKDKILTISKGEVKKNKNNDNLHDFKDVEYEPMTDSKLGEDICNKLAETLNRKSVKDNSVLDYKDGKITSNGSPLEGDQLKKFIRDRNGMPNPDDEYWEGFKFLAEGGKIGKTVGSFSLPPGTSCISGVPCAHQGCYAYRSFRNPTVRACWFANLAKLWEGVDKNGNDRFKQFEDECVNFIKKHKLTHFRFHVSGDVDIGENKSKYIQSICNIASVLGDVKFWTYTKDYAAWSSASVPENLVVILSAWGKFRPSTELQERHPVAFLYDKDDPKIMEYMEGINPAHFNEYETGDKNDPVVFCPCSDPAVKENVTCDRCKICFTRSAHHNVAFHKH